MHKPVLLEETISNLIIDKAGIYVDCTLGGGGHFSYLVSHLDKNAKIIAFDKDLDIFSKIKKEFDYTNAEYIHSDFRHLKQILEKLNIKSVDGIMMDLGVSSFQLDEGERGFSFHNDARLDMRMNRIQTISAWDIVNSFEEEDISQILFEYGEERYSRRIAKAICEYRQNKEINTTLELVEIIKSAVPSKYKYEKHPARKTFQAIRIAVNTELDALTEVLPQAVEVLKPGGRLCIITFHSLEDRIVKNFFKEESKDCICPPGFPICKCDKEARLKIMSRKPIIPSEIECNDNPRARSAKLRVATRI